MIIGLCVLVGGLARALVGSGHLSRWTIYPPVAAFSAYVGLGHILDLTSIVLILWVTMLASLNLALGYTQWESWKWMALRFGLPALVCVLPLIPLGLYSHGLVLYVMLSLLAGLFYPHRQRVFELLHLDSLALRFNLSWLDSSRLAESVAGACILGGLSIL